MPPSVIHLDGGRHVAAAARDTCQTSVTACLDLCTRRLLQRRHPLCRSCSSAALKKRPNCKTSHARHTPIGRTGSPTVNDPVGPCGPAERRPMRAMMRRHAGAVGPAKAGPAVKPGGLRREAKFTYSRAMPCVEAAPQQRYSVTGISRLGAGADRRVRAGTAADGCRCSRRNGGWWPGRWCTGRAARRSGGPSA
jgi:hypothetical protein